MATTPSSSPSPATCSAYDVLCDTFLVCHIASFQRGFPRDIVEWKRANESMRSPWGSLQNDWGLLPNLAVQTDNLRMLERLYRYYKEQSDYYRYNKIVEMSFDHIWRRALKCGNIRMAEWIDTNDPVLSHRDDDKEVQDTIECATGSNSGMEMSKWLLERRPGYKKLGHLFDMYEVVLTGNIELYQWLMDNVEGIQMTPGQMDVAAREGHLDMVRYLHQHSTAGCTTSAMDDAAHNGQLEVVKFLHEHRTEGCTTAAMDFAARNGHLEAVKFLHEHRTEGCTTNAMNNAAGSRHLEIVRFLQKNRTEGCGDIAWEHAAQRGDLETLRCLHELYPEHSMESALCEATRRGHFALVTYIVETGTAAISCVSQCRIWAKELGFVQIEACLAAVVDEAE